MTNKKTIAMVMYGLQTGGAELQFLELANYLNKYYNFKVYVFAKRGNLDKEFKKYNIELEIFDYHSKIGLLKAMYQFIKLIQNDKPSNIISTSFIGNSATLVVKKLLNIKNIISFQTVARCMSKSVILDRYVLNRFDCIVAGADQISYYLKEHKITETKIHVIHNWVDFESKVPTKSIEETFQKFAINKNNFNIGCIARFHKQKGHEYLIKAFATIRERKNFLYLVGSGPELTYIKQLVNEYELEKEVIFLGEQRDEDYLNLLNAFDMIVLPSLYEGLPRTLLDAMYFKKAILTTNVDGNVEAIDNNTSGILVEPKNPEALAKAIVNLMQDSKKRELLGNNAFLKVKESFDMKKQFVKISSLLQ